MEISAISDGQQKESQGKPESTNVATAADRASRERVNRKDQQAAQKLVRKKRLKAAHHRRLKASHTKG